MSAWRTADPVVRRVALAAVAWVAAYAATTAALAGDPHGRDLLARLAYDVPVATAAALAAMAARRAQGRVRRMWALVATAVALDVLGDIVYFDVYPVFWRHDVFPSAADALYLVAYLFVLPGVYLGFAPRAGRSAARVILDGSVLTVAIGFAGSDLLVRPILQSDGGVLATAGAVAYPTLDIVLLCLIASLSLASGRRAPAAILLIGAAYAVSSLTDTVYAYLSIVGAYAGGSWTDLGWEAWGLLLCLAAVVGLRAPARPVPPDDAPAAPTGRDVGLPAILAGVATMMVIVVVDVADGDGTVSLPVAVAALLSLLAVIARLLLTSGERQRAATELLASIRERERLATTDTLTGLGNRRVFDAVIRAEAERTRRQRSSLALLVVDLDRFKRVNELFGHGAGDAVLSEVAGRLVAATRTGDTVVRQGGEEFAILLPRVNAGEVAEIGDRIRQAVSERPYRLVDGATITLTTSVGAAALPAHARTADELVAEADRALTQAKALGRNRVHVGTAVGPDELGGGTVEGDLLGYLQRVVDEVEEDHNGDEHSVAVARWAPAVCDQLRLSETARRRCAIAARFHDVGKIAVPAGILDQRRPLTADEWQIVRQHPAVGARMLALAPGLEEVADIVACHHERWDGRGYPAGRRAEGVPIEARIIAVCDAWAAMRGERPYRRPLTLAVAREELRSHAGTQFDPAVVRAFLELEATGVLELDAHRAAIAPLQT